MSALSPGRRARPAAAATALLAALVLADPAAVCAADGPLVTAQAKPAEKAPASGTRTPAPADAYCYIGWPNNGDTIRKTHIKVWFGARNIGVAPAGVDKPNTGHHHLLIDTDLPPMDQPIPNDKNHLHFGNGQTETYIDLPPGKHTLQLLMGDANHVPHDPPVMSRKITINVQ
jgi:hypothetical protein